MRPEARHIQFRNGCGCSWKNKVDMVGPKVC